MLNQIDYNALIALAAVLRTGSFDGAAHALHVTPSAISQRIKSLEEKIGAVLVERGTPCLATQTGRRLARHAEDVGLLEATLLRDLGLENQAGQKATVSVALNADSLATWFCNAMTLCPDMHFHLEIDDQDYSADWLKRGAVSAAISSHPRAISGCDMHPLGFLRYHAVASPAFVTQHFAKGVTEESLQKASALIYSEKDRLQHNWVKSVLGKSVPFSGHRVPSTQAFVDAALLGLGWGLNPAPLLSAHLEKGDLVTLSPEPIDVPLYWHVSRLSAQMLGPLTKAVKQAAAETLIAPK